MGRNAARALALTMPLALLLPAAPRAQEGPGTDAPVPPPVGQLGVVPISVIFTNLPGDPTAQVPGHPGIEFGPGTGTTHFDRPYGSPNGTWILSADTTYPTTEDEVILVNGAVVVREGTAAGWTGGAENVGLIESRPLPRGRGREYVPTPAAEEFREVLNRLGEWGQRWATTQFAPDNLDLGLLMWNMRRRVNASRLPARRVVARLHGAARHADVLPG